MSKLPYFILELYKIDMNIKTQNSVGINVNVEQNISWLDRQTIWIDHLPFPTWLLYIGLILAGEILFNLAFWIDGSRPFWERVTLRSVSVPLVFLCPALYHYLTKAGSKALQDFRPLLDADEKEIAKIDKALNYLPSRVNWIILFLAIGGSIWYVFGSPNTFGDIVPQTILPVSIVFISSVIIVIPFYSQCFRIVRQVRILQDLYQRASNINLLHLEPAHAFARLTASTRGGLILLMVVGILYNPELGVGVNLWASLIAVFFGILIFIIPLMGLRHRLVTEKNQRLKEVIELLQLTTDEIHSMVRNQNNTEITEAKLKMNALIEEKELFDKVSTWPWDTGTIRGFTTTLILPIGIWFITRL
jgi:hypothetical protein